jgi:peptide/nickel transport system permease protein
VKGLLQPVAFLWGDAPGRPNLGFSFGNQEPVLDTILDRLPTTASLAIGAAVLWLVSGLIVGTISAVRRGRWLDRISMGAALVAISAPVYWLGLVALFLLADDVGRLKVFPGAGSYTPLATDPWAWFTSLLLPWAVLAASFAAFYARLVRGNLLDTMSEDYIRTARAKGLSEWTVVGRHALRNSLITVPTVIGLQLGALISGAVITETIFQIAGFGRLTIDAVNQRDYALIQGVVIVAAAGYVVVNLTVDVLYSFLNPRIRVSGRPA